MKRKFFVKEARKPGNDTTYDFEPLGGAWLASLVGDSGMVAKPDEIILALVICYSFKTA